MKLLFLFFILVFIVFPTTAQTNSFANLDPISLDNLADVVELAVLPLDGATQMAWSPDGETLVAATNAGIWLYSLSALDEPVLLGNQRNPVTSLAFSPDGVQLAASSGNTIRVWDVATNVQIAELNGTQPLIFSPDGRLLVSGAGDSTARVWDTDTLTQVQMFDGHTDTITGFAFSPNSTLIASASLDTTIRYWNPQTGEQVGFQRSRRRPVLSVAFNPAGFLIASGARQGVVRLLNIAVGTERTLARGQQGDVSAIGFSADSALLAFSVGNTLKIWHVNESEEVAELEGHTDMILNFAFNPDGSLIASVGRDDTLRLWGVA